MAFFVFSTATRTANWITVKSMMLNHFLISACCQSQAKGWPQKKEEKRRTEGLSSATHLPIDTGALFSWNPLLLPTMWRLMGDKAFCHEASSILSRALTLEPTGRTAWKIRMTSSGQWWTTLHHGLFHNNIPAIVSTWGWFKYEGTRCVVLVCLWSQLWYRSMMPPRWFINPIPDVLYQIWRQKYIGHGFWNIELFLEKPISHWLEEILIWWRSNWGVFLFRNTAREKKKDFPPLRSSESCRSMCTYKKKYVIFHLLNSPWLQDQSKATLVRDISYKTVNSQDLGSLAFTHLKNWT